MIVFHICYMHSVLCAIFPFLEPGAAWYLMQSIVLRASLVAPHQSTTTSSVYSQEISVALRLGWVVLNSLLALNSSESIAKRAVQWCWCRLRRKFFSTSNFSVCFFKSAVIFFERGKNPAFGLSFLVRKKLNHFLFSPFFKFIYIHGFHVRETSKHFHL